MNDEVLQHYELQKDSAFYAHLEPMYREIERLNSLPRRVNVLEWGSGISTIRLCTMLKPDAAILSIEHDEKYRFDIPDEYGGKLRQSILSAQIPVVSREYVTLPLMEYARTGQPYDLIVIDGRNRADCLAVAAAVLADDGTVILGDAERESYHAPYALFGQIDTIWHPGTMARTAVLNKPAIRVSARP